MSRQTHVRKGFIPAEEGQPTIPWALPVWVMGLTALLLVALAGLAVIRTGKSEDLRGLQSLESPVATSEFASLRGVAAVRAADDAQSAIGSSYAVKVLQHEGRDAAAIRAADATLSATGSSYAVKVLQHEGREVAAIRGAGAAAGPAAIRKFVSLRGVAAVRAADAGVSGTGLDSASEFAGLRGVAAVRAADGQ